MVSYKNKSYLYYIADYCMLLYLWCYYHTLMQVLIIQHICDEKTAELAHHSNS